MQLRPIEKRDNAAVAQLIRHSLEKEDLAIEGTAYFDPYLDDLAGYYQATPRSAYFVVEDNQMIIGAGGFAPVSEETAELQKLYVHEAYRGKGIASLLLRRIFQEAQKEGFIKLYLESSQVLKQALKVYEHFGFTALEAPMSFGNSHDAMDVWMLKDL
ncbi:GNAT family N-acetyltransferase [Streptococcus caviae]|uniref:GNAT family N-acetyltransferase n=1 Tax=Streptococcus sp. 'caviae' TaxID=1915004 RepID=UPI00094B884A|nr:GNAT family N-acetyltransferase [Streptococcus sp. 'caviae']OLN83857.1 GNAT family N-acetyltransferase [Streptococcus sp. 'caviae']